MLSRQSGINNRNGAFQENRQGVSPEIRYPQERPDGRNQRTDALLTQYPQGDSNPCCRTENPESWASRRWGQLTHSLAAQNRMSNREFARVQNVGLTRLVCSWRPVCGVPIGRRLLG